MTVRRALVYSVLVAAGLVSGAALVMVSGPTRAEVVVRLVNRDADADATVDLMSSDAPEAPLRVRVGARRREKAAVYLRGEGDVQIVARFGDGTTVSNSIGYAERGYVIDVEIRRDSVVASYGAWWRSVF